MAGMVIVNNPGDWKHVYPPLLHAQWHGWTPTDLIFPFFLFIVGVAITLSRRTGHWWPIVRRAATLVALGLLLNALPTFNLATSRIPGVLQRIGLCYLASALLYRWLLVTTPRGSGNTDRKIAGVVATLAVALLLGYWAVLALVPGASGRPGDLTPEGNVGAVIDRAVLGNRLYRKTWDPEGLLSTVPAIGTTLLGLLAGVWIRTAGNGRRVVAGLAAGGAAAVALALAWDHLLPINKNLWTSSYAVFTAGLGALLFAACYGTIDLAGWRRWAHPLVVLGSNAIALYVLAGVLAALTLSLTVGGPGGAPITLKTWIYNRCFAPLGSPVNASLLYALSNLAVLYVVLWVMYRRGVFLKV